jgi:hypothetical protein
MAFLGLPPPLAEILIGILTALSADSIKWLFRLMATQFPKIWLRRTEKEIPSTAHGTLLIIEIDEEDSDNIAAILERLEAEELPEDYALQTALLLVKMLKNKPEALAMAPETLVEAAYKDPVAHLNKEEKIELLVRAFIEAQD